MGWVDGLVQTGVSLASLLAQKEARKRQSGEMHQDNARSKQRAWEDLEIQQPRDKRDLLADMYFQRGSELGAPGGGYLRNAMKLQTGQREQREDLGRRMARGDSDLDLGLERYETQHAADYLQPIMGAIGKMGISSGSGFQSMPSGGGLPDDAKISSQLPSPNQSAANTQPIWSGDDAGRYDPFSDEEFLKGFGRL